MRTRCPNRLLFPISNNVFTCVCFIRFCKRNLPEHERIVQNVESTPSDAMTILESEQTSDTRRHTSLPADTIFHLKQKIGNSGSMTRQIVLWCRCSGLFVFASFSLLLWTLDLRLHIIFTFKLF